jgi:hypothetical protein
MTELGSVYARGMIEMLLHVHALMNMYRSSDNDEYRKSAADWVPRLESQFASLKHALAKETPND